MSKLEKKKKKSPKRLNLAIYSSKCFSNYGGRATGIANIMDSFPTKYNATKFHILQNLDYMVLSLKRKEKMMQNSRERKEYVRKGDSRKNIAKISIAVIKGRPSPKSL